MELEIKIDGIPIEQIYSHYKAIGTLFTGLKEDKGYHSTMSDWDRKRGEVREMEVTMTAKIKET